MTVLSKLFYTIEDFREVAPGINAQNTFAEMNSAALSAKKQILNIISKKVWESVVSDLDTESYHQIQIAIANLTMYKHIVFNIIAQRLCGSATEVYKHELETMQRQYIDNYYNAMDTLVQELNDNKDWQATPHYLLIEKLKIKTVDEFDSIYPIDQSYLFFFRTQALQREILTDTLSSYFTQSSERAGKFDDKLKLILALKVIALALRRFDIIEFPATIRSLHKEAKALRHGTSENNIQQSLAQSLETKAQESLRVIDLALDNHDNDGSVDTETSFNRPDDNIYFI